jgi:hypothetical protein
MSRWEAPAGFVLERSADAISVVDRKLEDGARALGLFERDGIDRALAAGERIVGGRGSAVVLAWPHPRIEVVAREVRRGGALAAWLGSVHFGALRSLRELHVTQTLREHSAPVPTPAFALARRKWGPLWRCAIGTLRAPGDDLVAALRAAPDADARERALGAAATAVRAFHDRGGRHADLNASNVLLAARDGRLTGCVIDLDRARVCARVPARRRARELARLWRSLAKRGGTARLAAHERDAFVAAYCAGDLALARALSAPLRRERVRSALHAWRYPRR